MLNVFNRCKVSTCKNSGFSLVEMLLALGLMGMFCLMVTEFLVKGNSASASLNMRYKEATEVQNLILDIQNDIAQGAYISDNSHKNRLEYTTYDNTGSATKKIYKISTYFRHYLSATF